MAVLTPEFQGILAGRIPGLDHEVFVKFVHGEQINLSAYEREVLRPLPGSRALALGFQEPVEAEEPVQVSTPFGSLHHAYSPAMPNGAPSARLMRVGMALPERQSGS